MARYIPQMGYYLVVTDTEATERCYFTGLHENLSEYVKNKENYLVRYIYISKKVELDLFKDEF